MTTLLAGTIQATIHLKKTPIKIKTNIRARLFTGKYGTYMELGCQLPHHYKQKALYLITQYALEEIMSYYTYHRTRTQYSRRWPSHKAVVYLPIKKAYTSTPEQAIQDLKNRSKENPPKPKDITDIKCEYCEDFTFQKLIDNHNTYKHKIKPGDYIEQGFNHTKDVIKLLVKHTNGCWITGLYHKNNAELSIIINKKNPPKILQRKVTDTEWNNIRFIDKVLT